MGYSPYQLVLNFCHQQYYLFQHRLAWPSSKKPQTFCVNFIAISHDGCSAAFSGIFRATQISVFFRGFSKVICRDYATGYLQMCSGLVKQYPKLGFFQGGFFCGFDPMGCITNYSPPFGRIFVGTFLKHFHSKIQE